MLRRISRIFRDGSIGVTKAAAWIFFSQLFAYGCQFITSVMLARALQPAARGQYAILVLIPTTLFTIGNLGLGIPTGHFAAKDPTLARRLNANNVIASLGLTAVYSALLFVLHAGGRLDPLADFLSREHMILISAALWLLMFGSYAQSLLLGRNYIAAKSLPRINEVTVFIVLLTALSVAGRLDLAAAFTSWVVTLAVGAGTAAWFLFGLKLFSLKPDYGLLKKSVKMGTKGFFAELAGFVILQSDLLLIRYFIDDAATGVYAIAASLSFILMSIPQSIGLALFPHISKVEHLDGLDGTDRTILSFRLTFLITLVASSISMILAPFLIHIVYGSSYDGALYPFLILAGAVTAGGCAFVLDAQLYARGLIWVATVCSLFAAGLNILLNIYLIPRFSLVGAAASSLVSYAFYGAALSFVYLKLMKRRAADLRPRTSDVRLLYGYLKSVVFDR